ncbi:MAG: asparagine synthase (glutamine-hydrolyzing) [Sphingorhabdus sp.]
MCGIYGIQGAVRSPDMGLAAMRRRGPDQLMHWDDASANIWLGHARLSIIDLSVAGNQPMHSPDGRWVMVYNGEIYNYRELRAELEAVGEQFVGHSDSEVFLRLFMREGSACFSRLNGIFAVAFWDRHERSMTLARDPMGVKPLYFAEQPHGFAFASEIKALIRGGDVVPKINKAAVLHHLGLLWSPGSDTIVDGVHKLLPGEAMTVKNGAVVQRWIYADPTLPSVHRPATANAEALAAKVHDAVETAVQRQLVSDVPLGAFLSGGLDSSSIAAFAARHRTGPGKLQCFSIEIADGAQAAEGFADDLPYARKVAQHLDVDLHVVKANGSMLDRLSEMIYYLDEPTADLAAINTLLISELARAQGITVLLSGAGGDDIFTGYRRHYALMQERFWSWLPLPARSSLAGLTGLLPKNIAQLRRIAKAFQFADKDADTRLAGYFGWITPTDAYALLSADLRAELTPGDMLAPLLTSLSHVPAGATALQKMLYLECKHFLVDHNLNYADKMGMAASIEIRVPLLDHDLVALAMGIPDDMKQHGRIGKWIFKKAMEPVLPHEVIYRPKSGFGVPLRQWLLGPLDALLQDTLSPARLKARGIFDAEAVVQLLAANRSGQVDASYSIFAILCMELWCVQYLDGQFAVDLT